MTTTTEDRPATEALASWPDSFTLADAPESCPSWCEGHDDGDDYGPFESPEDLQRQLDLFREHTRGGYDVGLDSGSEVLFWVRQPTDEQVVVWLTLNDYSIPDSPGHADVPFTITEARSLAEALLAACDRVER